MPTAKRSFVNSLMLRAKLLTCLTICLVGLLGGVIFHWKIWLNGWIATAVAAPFLLPLVIFHPKKVQGSKIKPRLLHAWMLIFVIPGIYLGRANVANIRTNGTVALIIFAILFSELWYWHFAAKIQSSLDNDSSPWIVREYT